MVARVTLMLNTPVEDGGFLVHAQYAQYAADPARAVIREENVVTLYPWHTVVRVIAEETEEEEDVG